jgi:hypothetical protein
MITVSESDAFKAIIVGRSTPYNGLGDVIEIITNAMSTIGIYSAMSGRRKKKFVIECLEGILEPSHLEVLMPILTHLIDTLIKVENGQLRFNKKITKCCTIS